MNATFRPRLDPARAAAATAAALTIGLLAAPAHATNFNVVNLVSDGSIPAAHTDGQLLNPWGLASSAASPFWAANNVGGLATLYNTAGVKQALVVTVAGIGGNPADPTGVVFNGTSSFGRGRQFRSRRRLYRPDNRQ
jgi:hypothetical protein